MDRVKQRAARSLGPSQAFGERPWSTLGAHLARFEEKQHPLAKGEGGFDFRDPDTFARVGVSFREDGHHEGKLCVVGVGMVAPKIAVETGGALDWPGRALVKGAAPRKRTCGDEPMERAFRGLKRLAQPRARRKIPTQSARDEDTAEKAASSQPGVELLGPLLEKLALRLADLQRRRVAQMSEIVEVIVEPFEFGEQNAERSGANGRLAACCTFDGLAISKRVSYCSHS